MKPLYTILVMTVLISFGCTNKYINSTYKNVNLGNRNLSFCPVSNENIHIQDSTLLDFITDDFGVSKNSSIAILDSMLNSSINKALVLNTDNVIFTPCQIPQQAGMTAIKMTDVSKKDQRILNKLGISIPDEKSLSSTGCFADFALLITGMSLDIGYDVKFRGLGTPVLVVVPQNRYKFVAEDIGFLIWDYKNNSVVCSGKIDAIAFAQRCSQILKGRPNDLQNTCNNKDFFWPHLLSSIGNEIIKSTPFCKNTIDSIMNFEEWQKMKVLQLVHPLRDSVVIASKLEKIYPKLEKVIDDIAASLGIGDFIRMSLTILPNGDISEVQLRDSVKIDSVSAARLNADISGKLCDSIENPKLFTFVVLKTELLNSQNRIQLDTLRNIELRSKASILQKVMKGIVDIRYAYNRRLKEGMGKDGKITVKFAIDEYGKVIHSSVVSSTINDPKLEQQTVDIIKKWKFEKIYNPGDVCEVVYPFVFSR